MMLSILVWVIRQVVVMTEMKDLVVGGGPCKWEEGLGRRKWVWFGTCCIWGARGTSKSSSICGYLWVCVWSSGKKAERRLRLGKSMFYGAGRESNERRIEPWRTPGLDWGRMRRVCKRHWEKMAGEREAKPGDHDSTEELQRACVASSSKSYCGTRRMRSGEWPRDPARRRSLVT